MFNGVFFKKQSTRIKDGAYVINLVDKKNKGTQKIDETRNYLLNIMT